MRADDETTAVQLHKILAHKGHPLSLHTILRCRTELRWTFRGSAYCQLIRTVNKVKRLQWATEHQDEDFSDVLWTDEASIQLQTHRRFCCRKRGEPPKNKPRCVEKFTTFILCGNFCIIIFFFSDLNTLAKSMSGQGLVARDPHLFAFSKAS